MIFGKTILELFLPFVVRRTISEVELRGEDAYLNNIVAFSFNRLVV